MRCRYIDSPPAKIKTESGVVVEGDEGEQEAPPSRLLSRLRKMSGALCEVLDEYGLVHFLPINVQDGEVRLCRCLTLELIYLCVDRRWVGCWPRQTKRVASGEPRKGELSLSV